MDLTTLVSWPKKDLTTEEAKVGNDFTLYAAKPKIAMPLSPRDDTEHQIDGDNKQHQHVLCTVWKTLLTASAEVNEGQHELLYLAWGLHGSKSNIVSTVNRQCLLNPKISPSKPDFPGLNPKV